MLLQNKVALVTGSGKGIGSGIALDLAANGADVVIHYHSSSAAAEEIAGEVRAMGRKAVLLQADVSDASAVRKLVADSAAAFDGRLDILVNNAAIQYNLGLFEYSREQFYKLFHTNLRAYLIAMQEAYPIMARGGGGRMILISSVHAKRPTNFDPPYSMAKGAIKMMTREAALEYAKAKITVNSIEYGAVNIGVKSGNPAWVVTPEMEAVPKLFDYMQSFPMGKHAQPEDVSQIISFLASDGAHMITGAGIRVDGGNILL